MRIRDILTEAVHRVPLTEDQFDELKLAMNKPIPAEIAMVVLSSILESDELSDEFIAAAKTNPSSDVRPLIANWIKLNMPAELHRFTGKQDASYLRQGIYSALHGYHPSSK